MTDIRKRQSQWLARSVFSCVLALALPTVASDHVQRADGSVWYLGKRYIDLSAFHGSKAWATSGARCGTEASMASRVAPTPSEDDVVMQARVEDCTLSMTQISAEYDPLVGSTFVIPVYFHVIYNSSGTGNISQASIDAQMAVLNEDFAGVGGPDTSIRFELAGVTRTQNDTWFTTNDEDLYKPTLSVDASRYLNIYTKDFLDNTLGYAYLPPGAAGRDIDGIVMLYNTIGGRDNGFGNYDDGRTLVHEIGHYLGLFHTFNASGGTCENTYSTGDFIVDTAPHGSPDFGCSASSPCGPTTPIENFMNYSDDRCMDAFSVEQVNRMICSLTGYRPNAFRIDSGETPPEENEEIEAGLPIWLLLEAAKRAANQT